MEKAENTAVDDTFNSLPRQPGLSKPNGPGFLSGHATEFYRYNNNIICLIATSEITSNLIFFYLFA